MRRTPASPLPSPFPSSHSDSRPAFRLAGPRLPRQYLCPIILCFSEIYRTHNLSLKNRGIGGGDLGSVGDQAGCQVPASSLQAPAPPRRRPVCPRPRMPCHKKAKKCLTISPTALCCFICLFSPRDVCWFWRSQKIQPAPPLFSSKQLYIILHPAFLNARRQTNTPLS